VSNYPEHDKQAEVVEQTQAIGEFIDWLGTQGIHLMMWREDLTDERPTDPECPVKVVRAAPNPCDPSRDGSDDFSWYRRHCQHWQDPDREADGEARQGTCCRCQRGRHYEIRNVKAWTPPGRSTLQLLADWAAIDLRKIEAEKRQMLEACRAANARQG